MIDILLISIFAVLISIITVCICNINESYKKEKKFENLFLEKKVIKKNYRLGDMVRSKPHRKQNNTAEYHLKFFPNSIASKYLQKTQEQNNIDVLIDILSLPLFSTLKKPKDNEIVIHIRGGDVLNPYYLRTKIGYKNYNIDTILKSKYTHSNWVFNVKKYQYYKDILDRITLIDKNLKNIVMVNGCHTVFKNSDYDRNKIYVKKLYNFFESNGFNVVDIRYNEDADEDFY